MNYRLNVCVCVCVCVCMCVCVYVWGVMLNIIKVFIMVYHPIPTHENRKPIFKINQLCFRLSVQVYSLFGQTQGEREAFFEGCNMGGHIVGLPPKALVCQRDEKVSPFVKFEIILPLLCFLLSSLTNKHCRPWSSMINLWIDSRTYQK